MNENKFLDIWAEQVREKGFFEDRYGGAANSQHFGDITFLAPGNRVFSEGVTEWHGRASAPVFECTP